MQWLPANALGSSQAGRYTALNQPEAGVSDSDTFIHEVSEEVRRDRLFAFLRRWGWLIGLGLALIIGGAAANEWRKARAEVRAEAAGDALRAAIAETDPMARADALARLADTGDGPGTVANFVRAGSLAEAGETETAEETLAALATSPDLAETYRALASIQRVMVAGDGMERSELLAALDTLALDGAPFRPLALELRALASLEAGETDAALSDLAAVLDDPSATDAMRARARQVIVAAGGALPLGGVAPGLPAPAGG